MNRAASLGITGALILAGAASASECILTVAGESVEFPHVVARTTPNRFDDTKENIVIHCFREEVPEDKRSADEIIWFQPESGRIDIEITPPDFVTSVNINSESVTGMVSGMNFGVEFEGKLEGDQLTGSITTTEDLTTLFNGEESEPWRVSATLAVGIVE